MDKETKDARARILAAAVAMVDEGADIRGITLRQVAERAEVGLGLINYHFGSRDALLSIAVREAMSETAYYCILHSVVIKAEYYVGKGCWAAFAVAGLMSCIASLFVRGSILPVLLGVLAFSLFWCIHELFEQEEQVQKGRYRANPAKVKGDVSARAAYSK